MRDRALLSLFAIGFYATLSVALGVHPGRQQLMLADDSATYQEAAAWLAGGPATDALAIRPLLYPVLVAIAQTLGGYIGVWFLQAMLWLASINLLFAAAKDLFGSRKWAWVLTFILTASVSAMFMTYYMLTETLALFLNAWLIREAARKGPLDRPVRLLRITCVLVLICLVKPQAMLVLLPVAAFCAWRILREPHRRGVRLAMLALMASPLLLQVDVVHDRTGSYALSDIGSRTMRDYLYAQGLSRMTHASLADSRSLARSRSNGERWRTMAAAPAPFLAAYASNLSENLRDRSFSLELLQCSRNSAMRSALSGLTDQLGYLLLPVHALLVIPIGWMAIARWRRREPDGLCLLVLYAYLTAGVLTTGVSAWQMDRLVLPYLPVWLLLYAYAANRLGLAWTKESRRRSVGNNR